MELQPIRPVDRINPDRRIAQTENRCTKRPFGCGKLFTDFSTWSPTEQREYKISGLCKECQDRIFKEPSS